MLQKYMTPHFTRKSLKNKLKTIKHRIQVWYILLTVHYPEYFFRYFLADSDLTSIVLQAVFSHATSRHI